MGNRNWNGKVFLPFGRQKPFGDMGTSGGGNKVWQRLKSYIHSPVSFVGERGGFDELSRKRGSDLVIISGMICAT
jgi:hypothetical protein